MTDRPLRLPPIPEAQLTAAQRAAADEVLAGPRGSLEGPFVALLRSPALMSQVQRVGAYLRYDSALPRDLFELAVLAVAQRWDCGPERTLHEPLALQAGLSPDTVAQVLAGRTPTAATPPQQTVLEAVEELHDTNGVTDATYAALLGSVGPEGVVDLVAAVGYYTMLAMVMNVAGTPSPAADDDGRG